MTTGESRADAGGRGVGGESHISVGREPVSRRVSQRTPVMLVMLPGRRADDIISSLGLEGADVLHVTTTLRARYEVASATEKGAPIALSLVEETLPDADVELLCRKLRDIDIKHRCELLDLVQAGGTDRAVDALRRHQARADGRAGGPGDPDPDRAGRAGGPGPLGRDGRAGRGR